jgi:hypothetical protein
MSEDRKGFTVNDRRHFTADGQVRPERIEESPVEATPTAAEPILPAPVTAAGNAVPPPAERPMGHAVSLADLLVQLAGNASVLLGLAAPEGEAPHVDLDGAREVIGILEMLRDKTEGRRTAEEDKLLQGILYELRMSFVGQARVGGA